MAEQVLEMYPIRIRATRLWPDYSPTSPHAHTLAHWARTRATSRGGALFFEQWPKSGTPDRPIAVIGYPLNTVLQRLRTISHWSKPHRIRMHVHRVHPIMAEQVLEMYPTRIRATRLWPDYSTTSPHAHTLAHWARTRATSRGGALFFRLVALFPEPFFADHEVAVTGSAHTHKAQKRIFADGFDIDHRLPGHGHGSRWAKDLDAPFQMAQGDMFVAWRAREMYCRHLSHHTPRNDLII